MTLDEERAQEYRDEARQDEAEENECPCCGGQLRHKTYRDDGQTVGSQSFCISCQYASGTEYGQTYLELPEGFREDDFGEIVKIKEENDDTV